MNPEIRELLKTFQDAQFKVKRRKCPVCGCKVKTWHWNGFIWIEMICFFCSKWARRLCG
jgi:hypothetical protein